MATKRAKARGDTHPDCEPHRDCGEPHATDIASHAEHSRQTVGQCARIPQRYEHFKNKTEIERDHGSRVVRHRALCTKLEFATLLNGNCCGLPRLVRWLTEGRLSPIA